MSFAATSSSPTSSPPEAEEPSAGRRLPQLFGMFTLDRVFVAGLCVASVGFFAIAYSISLNDPEYFSRQVISSYRPSDIDPITTGAIVEVEEAMPAPRLVRARPPVAGDYQIVMLFGTEAILATADELLRVKVGSSLPGLGEILAIDPTDTGGTVRASKATLRTVTR